MMVAKWAFLEKIDCERTSFFDIVDMGKEVGFQNGDGFFL